MTRARDRLVLTRVERRFGMEAGGSSFLEEMGLGAEAVGRGTSALHGSRSPQGVQDAAGLDSGRVGTK